MRFLQIFVLSESDSLDAEVGAIEAGANEFLVAPLRDRALRARVQSNLRHKEMVDSLDDSETVLFTLAKSVEDRDPDLSQHCQRLSIMAAAMGVALQLPAHDIFTLQRGGYLHDIGKISIPDRILFKPGPLTPDEWETMKSHTVRGENICSGIKSLAPVLPIIRSHHERWDGLGYPDGLRGEQIPLLARILQLADIYDALTTVRPYKAAFTPEEALSIIMEETGKGWRDPHLVRVFADLIPMFRNPSLADLTRFSLNALAQSVETFRKDAQSNRPKKIEHGPVRLAG
jgi:putative two-component system response regulator